MQNYNVVVHKNSTIGSFNKLQNCEIVEAFVTGSFVNDCKIYTNAKIKNSVLENSIIKNNASVGVYSHLRPNSTIGENVKIGNFVETKNSEINENSKVSHLTYVGDAKIGKNVNVGCGTVFCNYNGKIKQQTIVGDNVFIGSNSNLIAPLIVESESFIGAGSTITKTVPSHCLAIARAKQINKENKF